MCKYNLFIIVYKDEYRELRVSKEPVLGCICNVGCAWRGKYVAHGKTDTEPAGIQNSTSFLQDPQAKA